MPANRPNIDPKSGMVTTPVQNAAPTMGTIESMLPQQSYQTLTTQVQAPQLSQLNASSLSPLNNQQGAINQFAQQQYDMGLKALQNTFNQQNQLQREMSAQRGIVGSGQENETMQRLYQQQGDQAGTMYNQVMNQALGMQIQDTQQIRELQRQGELAVMGLQNQRDLASMDATLKAAGMNIDAATRLAQLNLDKAMKEGDWQAAAEHDRILAELQTGDINARQWAGNQDRGLEREKFNAEQDWKNIDYARLSFADPTSEDALAAQYDSFIRQGKKPPKFVEDAYNRKMDRESGTEADDKERKWKRAQEFGAQNRMTPQQAYQYLYGE